MQHLRWLLLAVLTLYSKVSWGACSLISRLHILLILIKMFHETQIILYYYVTKQFLPCLNWMVTCFRFYNMFWKNNCFQFLMKNYTKHCASNCVIARVRTLSSPALCGCSCLRGIWANTWRFENMTPFQQCHNKQIRTSRWKSRFWFRPAFVYSADLKTTYFATCLCCTYILFNYIDTCRWL